MNVTCPEVVDTVTNHGGFPWPILVILAIVAAFFLYRKGIIGTKGTLRKLADKAHAEAQKLEALWKSKVEKEKPGQVPLQPNPGPAATTETGLTAAQRLLIEKKITLEEYQALTK